MHGNDLQDTLVTLGAVTPEQVQYAERASAHHGSTWLEQLVAMGAIDEALLIRCIVARASVPPCGLARLARVPRDVIELVPDDLAIEHRAVPVGVETDGDLWIAMQNPMDEHALAELGFFSGRNVLRAVASPTEILWALQVYYAWDGWLARDLQSKPVTHPGRSA
jgi:hypothetical protein